MTSQNKKIKPIKDEIKGVGLGMGWFKISSKIRDHRFHIASIRHDASWDAWYLYKGKITWGNIAKDRVYRDMVRHLYHAQSKHRLSKKDYFKREDQIFFDMCLALSRNDFEVLQAKIAYSLVRIRSLF